MKKKKFITSVALFSMAALWISFHRFADTKESNLILNNIEAIATGESGDTIPCWASLEPMEGSKIVDCESCGDNDGYRPMGAPGSCVVP